MRTLKFRCRNIEENNWHNTAYIVNGNLCVRDAFGDRVDFHVYKHTSL